MSATPSGAWPPLPTLENVVAVGDKVVIRCTTTGTHRGELTSTAPTSNRIAVTAIGIFRITGDKVVESWDEYDVVGLIRQLGVSPAG